MRRPVAVACALILAVVTLSCTHKEGRVIVLRASDDLYGARAPLPGSTGSFPRFRLGYETRLVLAPAAVPDSTSGRQVHARWHAEIPNGARLEFGYGLKNTSSQPVAAVFTVTLQDDDTRREIFRKSLAAAPASITPWQQATVELSGVQGPRTLEFATEPASQRDHDAIVNVAAIPSISEPSLTAASQGRHPLNLVLVSLDTLRADHLGVYGYDRPTSPHMDEIFGKHGVVVNRVFSEGADTILGHTAMLTGLNPATALIKLPKGWVQGYALLTLAETLRGHGYSTAAFTEDGMLAAMIGFYRGFDRYQAEWHPDSDVPGSNAARTFDRGIAWLEQHADEPFFLFLHTYAIHSPYEPPEPFRQSFQSAAGANRPQEAMDLYDASIAYADSQVERLAARLDNLGLADNTIFVVTSDHGEEFGEHGRLFHGTHVTNEIVHVPLMIRAPSKLPAGVVREGPAGLISLVPTLLDLLDLQTPMQVLAPSLVDHLTRGIPMPDDPIFSEAWSPEAIKVGGGKDPEWIEPSFGVTRWPLRLIRIKTREGARYELYDLDADPGEKHNLYEERRQAVTDLRKKVDGYLKSQRQRRASLEQFISPASATQPPTPQLDPEHEQNLRALGYIQ